MRLTGWAGSAGGFFGGKQSRERLRVRAWWVSIGLHVLVLGVLSVARLPGGRAEGRLGLVPTGRLNRPIELMAAPVMPKPRVRPGSAVTGESRYTRAGEENLPWGRIFESSRPGGEQRKIFLEGGEGGDELVDVGGEAIGQVEFFGSLSRQRRICYVVDCSGSMQGIFGRVRSELKESIRSLLPDQYFHVIFFGGGKVVELGGGGLVRATSPAKSAAYAFIDAIQPAGTTNAISALERAMKVRDSRGNGPSVVYFLTDGFEIGGGESGNFSQRIENLLRDRLGGTRINTIGFLPQSEDRVRLERIAEQSGGEFRFIGDGR